MQHPTTPPQPLGTFARLQRFAGRLLRDESGAEVMEYVLIAGLIIVGTIVVIAGFGKKVMARWTSVNASM